MSMIPMKTRQMTRTRKNATKCTLQNHVEAQQPDGVLGLVLLPPMTNVVSPYRRWLGHGVHISLPHGDTWCGVEFPH